MFGPVAGCRGNVGADSSSVRRQGLNGGMVEDAHESVISGATDSGAAPPGFAERIERAVGMAAGIVTESRAARRAPAALLQEQLTRAVMDDEATKTLLLGLTDEVMRIRDDARAARAFRQLIDRVGAPSGLPAGFRGLVRAGAASSGLAPRLVMPMVRAEVRMQSSPMILPARDPGFARRLAQITGEGYALNINLLGEAVLGDHEADRRLEAVIARLRRPDVTYVSVKPSSVCGRLRVLDHDGTVAEVAQRLRRVYRAARDTTPATFVNLDMEEYRDLHITVDAFRAALDDDDLAGLDAGIVLQAYLPDTVDVLDELIGWATRRFERHGGRTKIRLVKGANLAMEAVDAEIHGWTQAPYSTKAEVDANYKRLIERLLDPSVGEGVRVGVASHNLFDISWAWQLTRDAGVRERVDIEMLLGMAPAQARATLRRTGSVLLYAPVVDDSDFDAAIAYLVRRLDENTGPENFLRHILSLEAGSAEFDEQARRFRDAVHARHQVSTGPRRTQNRGVQASPTPSDAPFRNEPDTDFALADNRRWWREHTAAWRDALPPVIPAVIAGREVLEPCDGEGIDPSAPGEVLYRYTRCTVEHVDEAMRTAAAACRRWSAQPLVDRRDLLMAIADEFARHRGEIVAVMARDGGKTAAEADPEVSEGTDFARYYARAATRLGEVDGMRHEPLGVVVVTPPWNFPFAIPAGGVLAALAAGNAVILKPAPESVATSHLIARLCWAAGVPGDLLQFVPCADDPAGTALITHPLTAAVILTGSYETAQLFHRLRPDLRLHAETSGKNAIVITAAADLDLAVKDLVQSAFGHAGQKCSAASLAIVERPVYESERFRSQLRDATESLRVGPAWEAGTDVGPIISPPRGPLADALAHLGAGETWLVEPRQLDDEGYLWRPGVKLGVQPGSSYHRTECFGPVLGVMRADDLDDAIALQNAVPFGLTGGIHSLDDAEVDRWLERVEVGNAYVNRHITGAVVQRQPFGGWKRSSVGPGAKAGGPNYVASLGRWVSTTGGPLDDGAVRAASASYRAWWRDVGSRDVDPTGLSAEINRFGYRRLPRAMLRAPQGVPDAEVDLARAAAAVVDTPVDAHRGPVEDAVAALAAGGYDRLRILGVPEPEMLRAAHEAGVSVIIEPVAPVGEVELPRWLREQAVSWSWHRHGNVRPPRDWPRHAHHGS